jgi:MATE family multidrug resistance protein
MFRGASGVAAELRATLPIAAPLAAANLAQMVMALTNTIMVGHLGAVALSAVGLGGALAFTVSIVCQQTLSAVAPLAARAIGAGDPRIAGQVAAAGLVLAAIAAGPIMLLLSFAGRLLAAIGYDPALAAEIGAYLDALRWGVPGFLAFGVMRALLAAAHRARTVMTVVLVAIPANAVLNWMLVFGEFGSPALGPAGSGWATATIQWLMPLAVAAVLRIAPRHTPLGLTRRLGDHIRQVLRLGLPIGGLVALEAGLFATTGVVMGLFGADALGAHQLVLNFASLTFMVPLGIGQAATVRVAFELGAGVPAMAQRATVVALAAGAAVMAVIAVLMLSVPRLIVGVYVGADDPANRELVAIALQLLAAAALFQIADGVQAIAAGALRGYRDTAVPMLYAGFGYWGVGFAGGWVLAFPLGYGPVGLWWGVALGLAVVATLLTVRVAGRSGAALARTRIVPAAAPP